MPGERHEVIPGCKATKNPNTWVWRLNAYLPNLWRWWFEWGVLAKPQHEGVAMVGVLMWNVDETPSDKPRQAFSDCRPAILIVVINPRASQHPPPECGGGVERSARRRICFGDAAEVWPIRLSKGQWRPHI